jgi:hypothetical protein
MDMSLHTEESIQDAQSRDRDWDEIYRGLKLLVSLDFVGKEEQFDPHKMILHFLEAARNRICSY